MKIGICYKLKFISRENVIHVHRIAILMNVDFLYIYFFIKILCLSEMYFLYFCNFLQTNMDKDFIEVYGAREHNLKNIDVKIPRNELVVITGLSGSGKSSLAFDTIYPSHQSMVG